MLTTWTVLYKYHKKIINKSINAIHPVIPQYCWKNELKLKKYLKMETTLNIRRIVSICVQELSGKTHVLTNTYIHQQTDRHVIYKHCSYYLIMLKNFPVYNSV